MNVITPPDHYKFPAKSGEISQPEAEINSAWYDNGDEEKDDDTSDEQSSVYVCNEPVSISIPSRLRDMLIQFDHILSNFVKHNNVYIIYRYIIYIYICIH